MLQKSIKADFIQIQIQTNVYDGNPVGGWPGTEYWGLKLAKFAAAAAKPGKLPALKPGGN